MKLRRWIPRVILYAILLAAIVAAWFAVSELGTPEPPLPQDDLNAFEESLSGEMEVLLADRAAALSELESASDALGDPGWHGGAAAVGGAGFESVRNRASRILDEEVALTERPAVLVGLRAIPDMEEALDSADELYEGRLADGTAIQESIFREAMEAESGDYIRYHGYRILVGTLGRDTLRYRALRSLSLHEIKSTLYQTEFDTIRGALEESRADAGARAHDGLSGLDARYDELLADIVSGISEGWTPRDFESIEAGMSMEVLEDLRTRLAGFAPVNLRGGVGLQLDVRFPDRATWLAAERSRGEAFDTAVRGEVSD